MANNIDVWYERNPAGTGFIVAIVKDTNVEEYGSKKYVITNIIISKMYSTYPVGAYVHFDAADIEEEKKLEDKISVIKLIFDEAT